ncbi:MAG: bifunctional 5,10-methylenetetrahydrofolate dehydrogenase/5,10-methenyltetrahydrofolate cyclohydrolase [Candidatus Paceibacterota bacterium]
MVIDAPTIKKDILEEIIAVNRTSLKKKRVCFVQFGNDASSTKFIEMKVKMAQDLGIEAVVVKDPSITTEEALLSLGTVIEQEYDGIVVQLPLPEGIDTNLVIDSIPTEMDIDMISEDSKVHYRAADTERTAPVAAAVQAMLWYHKIILIDKKVVVVGRGRLVGESILMLLDRQELPYTVIDINTPEEEKLAALQSADVIISGTGVPHSITVDMVKEGVVLIDAGTSEQAGKLVGDIDPACYEKAQWYTPVPGGVGPLTVVCLFRNLFLS